MTINETKNGSDLIISLEGRLDTMTAPELEEELKKVLPETEQLTFDFEGLEYISSAGLRVVLSAPKVMSKQGSMKNMAEIETTNEVCKET